MKLSSKCLLPTILAMSSLAVSSIGRVAQAAREVVVSHDGVTVHIPETPFLGDPRSLGTRTTETLSRSQLPRKVAGYPVLETKAVVAAWTADGSLTFWTRRDNSLTQRAIIGLTPAAGPPQFRLVADDKQGVAIEVGLQTGPSAVVALSKDGILEIRQPAGRTVQVRSPLRYLLVPSLVGTDLLYDPETLSANAPSYLPSMNMILGLAYGNDGLLVGVWPPGEQSARLQITPERGPRQIESFSLDTAGESFHLAFLDHPNIWHAERLRDEYLETDTVVAWQRPFEARWIGRFYIDSDDYDFPFYFLAQKHKLWGRYIRGWFNYPVWFDAGKTMIHFEKKFPPRGTLLIYYLDTYDDKEGMLSPLGVMRRSLGRELAGRLLDFVGTRKQVLLEHGNAVCAMTEKIESYCAREVGAPPWAKVKQYTSDVATFVRLIRERVFQFDQFAAQLEKRLATAEQEQPALKEDLQSSREILAEVRDIVANDLPEVPLEEVRAWTDEIARLAFDDGQKNLDVVKLLTQQCRLVAGTQDDMARELSVVTIRLMEEAARMGTASPQHARLAEQVIARCRAVLRQPTWWEPCRQYLPKRNPGQP